MDSTFILYTLLYLNIISFILGYLVSHIKNIIVINNSQTNFKKKLVTSTQSSNIEIEEKKYVVNIDTSNMEKKYESLGEVKQTNDNIGNSINKLKNLKG